MSYTNYYGRPLRRAHAEIAGEIAPLIHPEKSGILDLGLIMLRTLNILEIFSPAGVLF
jgi:hypothetical protein